MPNKLRTAEELKAIIEEQHSMGRAAVSTSGCFDILHPGHVAYLEEAKALGDILIVMLNTDSSVRRLKGEKRPVVCQEDRAAVLSGLAAVDYVVFFDEDTPCRLISEIKPDVFAKGGDYRGKHIPEMDELSKYGGRVEYLSEIGGRSTTNIIEKIRQLEAIG